MLHSKIETSWLCCTTETSVCRQQVRLVRKAQHRFHLRKHMLPQTPTSMTAHFTAEMHTYIGKIMSVI
jgi:hypothetical protein